MAAAAAGAGAPIIRPGVDPKIVAMSTWTTAGRDCSATVYTLKGLCKMEDAEHHGDIGLFFDADKRDLARAHLSDLKRVPKAGEFINNITAVIHALAGHSLHSLLFFAMNTDDPVGGGKLSDEELLLFVKVVVLLKPDLITTPMARGMTPVRFAVINGYTEVACFLLEPGELAQGEKSADFKELDAEGMTLLHAAIAWGPYVDTVKKFKDLGADLKKRDGAGLCPAERLIWKIDNLRRKISRPALSDAERAEKAAEWEELKAYITPEGVDLKSTEAVRASMEAFHAAQKILRKRELAERQAAGTNPPPLPLGAAAGAGGGAAARPGFRPCLVVNRVTGLIVSGW